MMPLFQFKTVFLTSVTTLFVLGLFVQSYLVQEQNFGTFSPALAPERPTSTPETPASTPEPPAPTVPKDTKYLLVINKGGLNNQRRSIADAVVWASYLRRTLVLGHLMTKTGEEYDMDSLMKVSDIFDTSYINRFVPTIEVEDFIKQNKAAISSKALNMTLLRVPISSHSTSGSEYRHVVLDRLGLRKVNETITLPDGRYDLNDESDFARAIPILSDAPLLVLEAFASVYRESMTEHFPITKPNDHVQSLARDYVKKTGLINKQFISMHVRRTDFEDYCADKPVRSSSINKHRIKTVINPAFPTCWASWEEMAQGTAKVLINNTVFATSEQERNEFNIFLMTDADDLERQVFKQHLESILKKDFQDAQVNLFQFVPSDPSFSMETTGVVIESEIATFANDFIGNRYSSVSASTSSRWLELGKHYSHLYFW